MALMVLVYFAVLAFVLGNAFRVWRTARMPEHLRWELYPMPRGTVEQRRHGGSYFEETEWWTKPRRSSFASEFRYILQEVVTFATVWKRNRPLWLWSWLMHMGLYALLLATALAIISAMTAIPLAVISMPALVSSCAGLAGVTGLIAHRVSNRRLRSGTRRADLFHLAILAALFASTALVHIAEGGTKDVVTFIHAVLRNGAPPTIAWPVTCHIAILSIFTAYFPLTHMTHAYMKFFTYHRVRWDDRAIAHAPALDRAMRVNVRRPISWAAPHISGKDNRNWADVVAGRRS